MSSFQNYVQPKWGNIINDASWMNDIADNLYSYGKRRSIFDNKHFMNTSIKQQSYRKENDCECECGGPCMRTTIYQSSGEINHIWLCDSCGSEEEEIETFADREDLKNGAGSDYPEFRRRMNFADAIGLPSSINGVYNPYEPYYPSWFPSIDKTN